MSSRIKSSELKKYYNESTPIEERVRKIDDEIKKLKVAIIESRTENPMLSNALKRNLASLLQLREYIQIVDAIKPKEDKKN